MKKIIALILSLAVLCAVVTFCYTKLHAKEVVPEIAVNSIEGTINDIGELSTAEYVYKICQSTTKDGLKIPIIDFTVTHSEVIYSYEGMIKAGIRFGDIRIDVQEKDDVTKIYVHMPEVQIFSNELDNDSFEVYSEKLSAFNKVSFDDFNKSQKELKDTAEESAINSGLLERAEENAKVIVRSTILSFYDAEKCDIQFY